MITVLDIETTMDFESSSSSPYDGQQMVFVGYTSFTPDYLSLKQMVCFSFIINVNQPHKQRTSYKQN